MNNGFYQNSNPGLRDDYLEAMRETLAPKYRQRLSRQQVADVLREAMEAMPPMERAAFAAQSLQNTYEFSFKDIGKALGAVAKVAAPIAQIAAPLVGTMVGGPLGGMIGSKVGGLIGQAAQPGVARQVAAPLVGTVVDGPLVGTMVGGPLGAIGKQVGSLIGQVPGKGAQLPAFAPPSQPAPSPAPSPAAGQLLALLSNPQFLQAMLGQMLGSVGSGSASVQQGSQVQTIPFGAMMNTLSELAQRAAEESVRTGSEESESYLMDSDGGYRVSDPSNPEERADAVMEMLREDYEYRTGAGSSDSGESFGESAYYGNGQDSVAEWLVKAGMVR